MNTELIEQMVVGTVSIPNDMLDGQRVAVLDYSAEQKLCVIVLLSDMPANGFKHGTTFGTSSNAIMLSKLKSLSNVEESFSYHLGHRLNANVDMNDKSLAEELLETMAEGKTDLPQMSDEKIQLSSTYGKEAESNSDLPNDQE